jgi:hypothetical protein
MKTVARKRSADKRLLLYLLALAMVSAPSAFSECIVQRSKNYSYAVGLGVAAGSLGNANPVVQAVTRGVAGGTAIGEFINWGISSWWDPAIEVFPNDVTNIVAPITDAQILAVADNLLGSFPGPLITLGNLLSLNAVTPGMGDATVNLLTTGVRAAVHTAQGAAAFSHDGYGAPTVLQAATLLNSDLTAYRLALATFAPFLDQFNSDPAWQGLATITTSGYLSFLANVQASGASALPPGEVALVDQILSLANVHLEGTTTAAGLTAYLSSGDTGNEAGQFPQGTYSIRMLLEANISTFDIDCKTCSIASPEACTSLLLGTGLALLGCAVPRLAQRRRCSKLP